MGDLIGNIIGILACFLIVIGLVMALAAWALDVLLGNDPKAIRRHRRQEQAARRKHEKRYENRR